MMAGLAALVMAAGGAGLGWESVPPSQAEKVSKAIEKKHERGRDIYNFYCYFCHGYSGDAKTLASTYLSPPPRDFTSVTPGELDADSMTKAVTEGVPGTAMAPFENRLSRDEIEAVVSFVRREFILEKAKNTWYHTAENGWADHERYSAAFPFARGEIPLDTPEEELTPSQKAGRRLFMKTCVTCHDRAHVTDEGPVWRMMEGLSGEERRGERLYQENCAFCHARDGSGRNWFGAFLQPTPRDLTGPKMDGMTRGRLRSVIENGLPGTSMPAWGHVLSANEMDAIISYISKAFHPIREDGEEKAGATSR